LSKGDTPSAPRRIQFPTLFVAPTENIVATRQLLVGPFHKLQAYCAAAAQ
jgi:hypothetical protein